MTFATVRIIFHRFCTNYISGPWKSEGSSCSICSILAMPLFTECGAWKSEVSSCSILAMPLFTECGCHWINCCLIFIFSQQSPNYYINARKSYQNQQILQTCAVLNVNIHQVNCVNIPKTKPISKNRKPTFAISNREVRVTAAFSNETIQSHSYMDYCNTDKVSNTTSLEQS